MVFLGRTLTVRSTPCNIDGTPIISCETCDTWCHIICLIKLAGEDVTAEGIELWRKKDYTCEKCLDKGGADPLVNPGALIAANGELHDI